MHRDVLVFVIIIIITFLGRTCAEIYKMKLLSYYYYYYAISIAPRSQDSANAIRQQLRIK